MATKQLYLYSSYLREFEARVVSVVGNQVVLDQTAFHPLTGGVGHDTGFLTKGNVKFKVVRVEINRETKEISHVLEAETTELKPGDAVKGQLDWDRRYRLMRLHTAAHLIATIMYKDYSALITGGQVDVEQATWRFLED